MYRVFISHNSADKAFARQLAEALRTPEIHAWIDENEIYVGEDILDQMGESLRQMDLLVFLISANALGSEWVDREIKFATRREIKEKRVMILPFILDGTSIDDLPWFLQDRNVNRLRADQEGAANAAKEILRTLERRSGHARNAVIKEPDAFRRDPRVDNLITRIGPGNWTQAQKMALEILKSTDKSGRNNLLVSLLTYIHHSEEDEQFGVLHILESVAQLAPWLITRECIVDMANSPDFSVRSAAASICFDLAHLAPDRIPTDVVIELSRYDEDWYVTTPATATLKSMARLRPGVLRVFYTRLSSQEPEERQHAAEAIDDIADREPEILQVDDLAEARKQLIKVGDSAAADLIANALQKARRAVDVYPYKYGRF